MLEDVAKTMQTLAETDDRYRKERPPARAWIFYLRNYTNMFRTLQKVVRVHHLKKCYFSTGGQKNVAIVLSGSGVYDGTEITEGVATLVHLSRHGAHYQCFAPDKMQMHAVNHLTGEEHVVNRNVLQESGRLARGNVADLNTLSASDYDAVIFPGGFGAAKNLSSWAVDGAACTVEDEVTRVITDFHKSKKPLGACCIAPTLFAKCIPNCQVTVGSDADGNDAWPYAGTAQAINDAGGKHVATDIDGVVVDLDNKLATSCAYMYEGQPHEIFDSVGKMVDEVMSMA